MGATFLLLLLLCYGDGESSFPCLSTPVSTLSFSHNGLLPQEGGFFTCAQTTRVCCLGCSTQLVLACPLCRILLTVLQLFWLSFVIRREKSESSHLLLCLRCVRLKVHKFIHAGNLHKIKDGRDVNSWSLFEQGFWVHLNTGSTILTALQELTKQVANIGNNNSNNNNRTINNKSSINPCTGRAWRRYYWLCGCCNHWGRNCPNQKPGHQNDASFKDRKGGSINGVLGLWKWGGSRTKRYNFRSD